MGWFASTPPKPTWPREVPEFKAIGAAVEGSVTPWPDRHNSPNLNEQLKQTGINTIICSVLDSEPRLRLNAAVAARRSEFVVNGVEEILQRTGAKRAWVVMEARSPREWSDPIRSIPNAFPVVELPNDYPQADPVLLVKAMTGRDLNPGRLPTEKGVILIDAAGAATVGGLSHIPIGVLDHATGKATFLEVAPGMTLADVLAAAGFQTALRVARGGDLLRNRPAPPNQSIGEGENCIHLLTPSEPLDVEACIRCDWCAEVCPTRVKPAWILEAAQRGDKRLAHAGRREACIECGLCEQICPSRLPLLAAIRRVNSDDQASKSMPA
jgi:electron transport complex protein RnfC